MDMPHYQHPYNLACHNIRRPYILEIIDNKMVKEVENLTKDRIDITNTNNITKFSTEECDTKV